MLKNLLRIFCDSFDRAQEKEMRKKVYIQQSCEFKCVWLFKLCSKSHVKNSKALFELMEFNSKQNVYNILL